MISWVNKTKKIEGRRRQFKRRIPRFRLLRVSRIYLTSSGLLEYIWLGISICIFMCVCVRGLGGEKTRIIVDGAFGYILAFECRWRKEDRLFGGSPSNCTSHLSFPRLSNTWILDSRKFGALLYIHRHTLWEFRAPEFETCLMDTPGLVSTSTRGAYQPAPQFFSFSLFFIFHSRIHIGIPINIYLKLDELGPSFLTGLSSMAYQIFLHPFSTNFLLI